MIAWLIGDTRMFSYTSASRRRGSLVLMTPEKAWPRNLKLQNCVAIPPDLLPPLRRWTVVTPHQINKSPTALNTQIEYFPLLQLSHSSTTSTRSCYLVYSPGSLKLLRYAHVAALCQFTSHNVPLQTAEKLREICNIHFNAVVSSGIWRQTLWSTNVEATSILVL
jgi:hypothetical protein